MGKQIGKPMQFRWFLWVTASFLGLGNGVYHPFLAEKAGKWWYSTVFFFGSLFSDNARWMGMGWGGKLGKQIFYFDGSRRTYRCIKDWMISWSKFCFGTSEICETGMRKGVSQKKLVFFWFLLDLIKAHFCTKHAVGTDFGSFDEDATGCATRKWRIRSLTCIIIGKLHKLGWKLQTHTQD